MNRQAFTFLALFTLVLMLAVYYITLPTEDTAVIPESLSVNQEIAEQNDLQDTLAKKHQDAIDDSESVLSSNDSSTEDKLAALEKLGEVERVSTLEKQIQQALNEASFDECFVEIEDEVTRVVCPREKAGKQNAAAILAVVYQWVDQQKLVEVSFR